MRLFVFLLFLFSSNLPVQAQIPLKNDKVLEQKLRAALAGFRGNAGIYVRAKLY